MPYELLLRSYVEESIRTKSFLLELTGTLEAIGQMIADTLDNGHKLLLFGNGGSAADAQHIAAELTGRFRRERRGLPAIALTTDTSALTAIANDYGYDFVFARQLTALGCSGDLAVGISTSGNSPNVVRALTCARSMGMKTVGLTGGDGGEMLSLTDACVVIPSTVTSHIQECHITVGHALCELVDHWESSNISQ